MVWHGYGFSINYLTLHLQWILHYLSLLQLSGLHRNLQVCPHLGVQGNLQVCPPLGVQGHTRDPTYVSKWLEGFFQEVFITISIYSGSRYSNPRSCSFIRYIPDRCGSVQLANKEVSSSDWILHVSISASQLSSSSPPSWSCLPIYTTRDKITYNIRVEIIWFYRSSTSRLV